MVRPRRVGRRKPEARLLTRSLSVGISVLRSSIRDGATRHYVSRPHHGQRDQSATGTRRDRRAHDRALIAIHHHRDSRNVGHGHGPRDCSADAPTTPLDQAERGDESEYPVEKNTDGNGMLRGSVCFSPFGDAVVDANEAGEKQKHE